jgi:hypothetical protein
LPRKKNRKSKGGQGAGKMLTNFPIFSMDVKEEGAGILGQSKSPVLGDGWVEKEVAGPSLGFGECRLLSKIRAKEFRLRGGKDESEETIFPERFSAVVGLDSDRMGE